MILNTHFLFCDETANFRTPADPGPGEPFTLRVWAPREDGITVSFLFRSEEGSEEIPAVKTGEHGKLDIYELDHPGTEEELFYFVSVKLDAEEWLLGRNGLREAREAIPFSVNPAVKVPDWARGALWYQIFPDRFCNGDPSNDVLTGEIFDDVGLVSRRMNRNDPINQLDVHHFYGGDLQGVIRKLDYLKNLGVEVLYFNPLFVSPSSHGYNTQDYRHVDPHLGRIIEDAEGMDRYRVRTTSKANLEASDALLAELIDKAHQRGIRVILDGVFNHCSTFHAWENKAGLYPDDEKKAVGEKCFCENERGEKECWWGNRNLLKLNVDGCPSLREHIMQVAEKWLLPPYNADGWRLDVAADVGHSPENNHVFWQEFRRRVHLARPDALILAEHYGDPSEWLEGNEWDSVMNYDAFMEPVSWFFTGMEKHSDRYLPWMEGAGEVFVRSMEDASARFARPCLEAALNQLDNHDHSRFLTRTNHVVGRVSEWGYLGAEQGTDKSLLRAAVLLQMTWPGAPGIYYGDEVGLAGFTDPDNRRTFPWDRGDSEILDFYCNTIHLRKKHSCLRQGSLKLLTGEQGFLAYARFGGDEKLLVLINQTEKEKEISLDTAEIDGLRSEKMTRLLETTKEGYNAGVVESETEEGLIKLTLKPREAVIYRL